MTRTLAFVCLVVALASFGCATAELITPPPLASCDATGDCPLREAGADAVADGPGEAAVDSGKDATVDAGGADSAVADGDAGAPG